MKSMEQKADNPIRFLEGERAPALIRAYYELLHLKHLYRQGWLHRGVSRERCESVAEHSFGVAVLAMWLADENGASLDVCRVMRLALLHDIGEIYAGDIIPADAVDMLEKHRREAKAVRKVFGRLEAGGRYTELWEEYEAGVSPEARFVRQVDRLEMALQASVYRRQGALGMEEFFASTRQALSDPSLIKLLEEIG